MRKTITLAGWYGIGDREVSVTATASHCGVEVRAILPDRTGMDGKGATEALTWYDIEAKGEEAINAAAVRCAREVVRISLADKLPGEVYSEV